MPWTSPLSVSDGSYSLGPYMDSLWRAAMREMYLSEWTWDGSRAAWDEWVCNDYCGADDCTCKRRDDPCTPENPHPDAGCHAVHHDAIPADRVPHSVTDPDGYANVLALYGEEP